QIRNQIVIPDLKIWNWTRLLISPDKVGIRARQGAQKDKKGEDYKPFYVVQIKSHLKKIK
ncbi:MAG: hypothetical protein JSW63_01815, partial [Ignavibacterium sp.]